MKYVLDASVSIRSVITSPLTQKAIQLGDQYQQKIHELIAPDMFSDEVASALTKAERQRLISVGQAAPLYLKVMKTPPVLHSRMLFVLRAIDISSQTRSGFYDCLYLALAEREGCELVTADDKLLRNLQSQFPFIVHLSSLP